MAGSNCGATAALSVQLSAACPYPVTNQGAIGVTLGLGALLVVGGPGRGARPPMGGLPSCLTAPRPPWRCRCSWGGRALVLSPLLRGSLHCLAAPDCRWGCCPRAVLCCATLCCALPCCAVMCCVHCVTLCCVVLCHAVLCRAVLCRVVSHRAAVWGGGRRIILYPARRWWYTRKTRFLARAACLLAGRG